MRYRVGLETKDRILEATRLLVGENGLEGTTIKSICERAGILPGSFYNLFDSKEEVVLAVVREAIQAVEPDPQAPADIHSLVDAYVRFFEEEGDLARVYLEVAVTRAIRDEQLRGRVTRHHQRRVERFREALAAIGSEQPTEMAELLLATLNGLGLRRLLDPEFDLRRQAGLLLTLRPDLTSRPS